MQHWLVVRVMVGYTYQIHFSSNSSFYLPIDVYFILIAFSA